MKLVQMKERGGFRILLDTYVTEESGTGVVHQAPYFGEVCYCALNCLTAGFQHFVMRAMSVTWQNRRRGQSLVAHVTVKKQQQNNVFLSYV